MLQLPEVIEDQCCGINGFGTGFGELSCYHIHPNPLTCDENAFVCIQLGRLITLVSRNES